jgi:SagB-type dehydrogenase family enzyme
MDEPHPAPGFLRFQFASALSPGIERRKPVSTVTDAEREAVSASGKRYGRGNYDLPLAAEQGASAITLDDALDARRSVRRFAPQPLPLERVAAVLRKYRCSGELTLAEGTLALRTTASAGGLYPIEVYLVATRVGGLTPGLYHYRPISPALGAIRPDEAGEIAAGLAASLLDPEQAREAAGALVLTARFGRTTGKYGDRGYRYVLVETGQLVQTFALGAAAAGVGLVCHGAFYDAALNRLLGLDGLAEAALAVLLLGAPTET